MNRMSGPDNLMLDYSHYWPAAAHRKRYFATHTFMTNRSLVAFLFFLACSSALAYAEEEEAIRLGYLGSLTGIAASYGTEALDGVKLALGESSKEIKLFVEDDGSSPKVTLTAFRKLSSVDEVEAIIAGTWWANTIVKPAETQRLPILSVETSFNKETILGETYFLMLGDLRDWIKVFQPLIEKQKWKRGAVIHFSSGFGQTLAAEFQNIFSTEGREFVADLEYSDIDAAEARTLALKVKTANPDVLYIDGQPGNLANILKRLHELDLKGLTILTNSIAQDMCEKKLFDCSKIEKLYFNRRQTLEPQFHRKFKAAYGRAPYLDADIAYYSTRLLIAALESSDPIAFLKSGSHKVDGVELHFDNRNVLINLSQEIWSIENGIISKY